MTNAISLTPQFGMAVYRLRKKNGGELSQQDWIKAAQHVNKQDGTDALVVNGANGKPMYVVSDRKSQDLETGQQLNLYRYRAQRKTRGHQQESPQDIARKIRELEATLNSRDILDLEV